MEKQAFKERFERLYKGCEIFAAQFDGFSHKVFYKDADGIRHIDGYSAYCPEQYREPAAFYNSRGEMAVKSFNTDRAKVLFMGCGHYAYQNNAVEMVFKDLAQWGGANA